MKDIIENTKKLVVQVVQMYQYHHQTEKYISSSSAICGSEAVY